GIDMNAQFARFALQIAVEMRLDFGPDEGLALLRGPHQVVICAPEWHEDLLFLSFMSVVARRRRMRRRICRRMNSASEAANMLKHVVRAPLTCFSMFPASA